MKTLAAIIDAIVIEAGITSGERLGACLPPTIPVYRVETLRFEDSARALKRAGARLLAEWGVDETPLGRAFAVYAAFARGPETLLLRFEVPLDSPSFVSLTKLFVPAFRFERQIWSLLGLLPVGHTHSDLRPWIKHEDWPTEAWPLRKDFDGRQRMPRVEGTYPWVEVEGEGVYEIPVGPVHAGIIEPGHFRFQAMGEDILNLEERLVYTHKGVEKRFEALSWVEGARLSGRVSGDSTVGHSLTYCRALETLSGTTVPARAAWLRAILLERERIANHLGDIGAIANDAGFAFFFYQFMRLKEGVLRGNDQLFGHRYLMDRVIPGGAQADLTADGPSQIEAELAALLPEFERLVEIYERNTSLDDRLRGAGFVAPDTARELGLVGLVARASGQELDCRLSHPFPPYDQHPPRLIRLHSGDVHARAWARIEEIRDSARLLRELLATLPPGETRVSLGPIPPDHSSLALVEGWRGEIVYWLQSGPNGEINRCAVRDPSSLNWLGLEQAVHGNIVPDFPLCNKSFNQSYSGNDL